MTLLVNTLYVMAPTNSFILYFKALILHQDPFVRYTAGLGLRPYTSISNGGSQNIADTPADTNILNHHII